MGSFLGPIPDCTTLTRSSMSDFPLTKSADPNSSAQQSCGNSPSFVLPPALSAVMLAFPFGFIYYYSHFSTNIFMLSRLWLNW